jgi:hypothetical protein
MVMGVLFWAIGALGPGEYSLDDALGLMDTINDGFVGAAIAAGLGIGAGVLTLVCCYRPPAKES